MTAAGSVGLEGGSGRGVGQTLLQWGSHCFQTQIGRHYLQRPTGRYKMSPAKIASTGISSVMGIGVQMPPGSRTLDCISKSWVQCVPLPFRDVVFNSSLNQTDMCDGGADQGSRWGHDPHVRTRVVCLGMPYIYIYRVQHWRLRALQISAD